MTILVRLRRLLFLVGFSLISLVPGFAQDIAEPETPTVVEAPILMDARVSATQDRARVVIDLSAVSAFALATIRGPNRIAIDVQASAIAPDISTEPAGEGLVSGFSIELIEPGRARTWIELASPAKVQQASMVEAVGEQPARLVVDLIPATEQEFAGLADADLNAAMAAQAATSTNAETETAVETDAAPTSEATTVSGTKPLIVIDPGHGGADSGASGPNGIQEKDIVLSFSKVLRRLLVETGKFDVALTREGDEFLRLEDRVAIARQNKADLLISIHADYFQDQQVSGASIYTRDERATDVLDKILAEDENRVDIIAGFAVPKSQDKVVNILVDLMRREMRRQAYMVAQSIVTAMEPDVRMRRFPVRQANFMVLQAPDVPSLLVELGFLSNPKDIANLTTDVWRDKVAGALANGLAVHFNDLVQ